MSGIFPGMPLEDLAKLLTPEERAEVSFTFKVMLEEPGGRVAFRSDVVEEVERAFTAMALSGYSEKMPQMARVKREAGEPDADDCFQKALDSALKARAADAGNPLSLRTIAECLDAAGHLDRAVDAYDAFIVEYSQYPEDGEVAQDLIRLARERIAEIQRH